MKSNLFVSKDCVGCGACSDVLPQVFGMKGNKAHVKKQPETQEDRNAVADMKQACPVSAIRSKLK